MANGRSIYVQEQENPYFAASWDYPLGTRLLVKHHYSFPRRHIRMVSVRVEDRGPGKHLYRQGRILDLSKSAFQALAPLEAGVIPVTIERVQ